MTTLLLCRLTRRIAIALSLVVACASLAGCETYNCSQCHNFASAHMKLVYRNVNSVGHVRIVPTLSGVL
ncbi:hypothetical protein [Dyella tabacisoli]|uniref:Uncharacterized protein n=1 Tax=Dyella tabacisoli TaxID=2282381 RepID=A0A369USW3_9GAMM|nr:hypothetical protein [Dyella tabacisoli]RDD83567.1 hypothetical protein DVJ77_03040 [Dyella tabacisoli]